MSTAVKAGLGVLAVVVLAAAVFLLVPFKGAVPGPDCAKTLAVGEFYGTTETQVVSVSAQLVVVDGSMGLLRVGTLGGADAAQVVTDLVPGQCALTVGTTYETGSGLVRLDSVSASAPLADLLGIGHASATFTVQGA